MFDIFDGLGSELRFAFRSRAPRSPRFDVVKFEGREAISALFRFEITLVSREVNADLQSLISHPATLAIRTATGQSYTPYHGMLSEAEQLGQVDDYVFYRVVLVPRLAALALTHINEIYLGERSIPSLIGDLLRDHGLGNSDVQMNLRNPFSYRSRTFVCQYQETHLDFISRWMEKEGLYYFFDHEPRGGFPTYELFEHERMVITDHAQAHPDQALALDYVPPENVQTVRLEQAVSSFVWRRRQVPNKVIVQDYNYRNAALADDLRAESGVDRGASGQVMYYGDNLRTTSEAERLARVRSEQLECEAETFEGEASAVGIRSGHFLALSRHFRDECNGRFLVTRVQHRGSQVGVVLAGQTTRYAEGETGSTYQARFSAQRASQQFRAQAVTPRPQVAGFLSGVIDSEGLGNSAELDEYGQYKVQMLFDLSGKRASKGSAWVRMASPYAGDGHGMHFPLLKGTEVVIGFAGGDPDQPVILGAVTNSENRNVVVDKNARHNRMKSVSGNYITLSDAPLSRHIAMQTPSTGDFSYMGELVIPPPPEPDAGPDVAQLASMLGI